MTSSPQAGRLTLDRVSRRFGERLVVDEVSLDAPAGGVTVLVGPSGCGKTTLLRMIAGIERPCAGSIRIDDAEVAGDTAFVAPERRRVGLMFQDYALFPHLSALDNVLFGLGHLPRGDRRRVAEEALARVDLARHAGDRPGRLSGGEQQRLALARALAPAPLILLMDEPFSNLDRGLREEVRGRTLAVLRAAGVTSLLVTHDPEEALSVGDHLVLLERGRVIQAGPAGDLYARPTSIAAARALSEVSFVPGRFEGGALVTAVGAVPAPGVDAAPEGVAGFRPEHLGLGAPGEGLPGRIVERVFRGASTVLSIEVAGLAAPLRVSVPTEDVPGETEVGIVMQGGAGMVFAVKEQPRD